MQSTGEKTNDYIALLVCTPPLNTQTENSNGENRKFLFLSAAREMMYRPKEPQKWLVRQANRQRICGEQSPTWSVLRRSLAMHATFRPRSMPVQRSPAVQTADRHRKFRSPCRAQRL